MIFVSFATKAGYRCCFYVCGDGVNNVKIPYNLGSLYLAHKLIMSAGYMSPDLDLMGIKLYLSLTLSVPHLVSAQ